MDISTKLQDICLIVRLKGEFDMHSVPLFKEKIVDKMEKNNLKNLVLNFKGVTFIDSSGLGAILGRYRYLHKVGGEVVLVNLKPQVKKILNLAGMLKLMPDYGNEKEALVSLKEVI